MSQTRCTRDQLLDQAIDDERLTKTDLRVLKRALVQLDVFAYKSIDVRQLAGNFAKSPSVIAESLRKMAEIGYLERKLQQGQHQHGYRLAYSLPRPFPVRPEIPPARGSGTRTALK